MAEQTAAGSVRAVAVLAGGRSSEHEISLLSGAAVVEGLRGAAIGAWTVTIDREGVWRGGERELELAAGRGLDGADVVFPALHGPFGEDGVVQGMLETLDVAYVGSGVEASALCMDKVLCKALMSAHGFAQVDVRRRAGAPLARGPRRPARRAARARTAGLRQARPARLVGRDREGRRRGGSSPARSRARSPTTSW